MVARPYSPRGDVGNKREWLHASRNTVSKGTKKLSGVGKGNVTRNVPDSWRLIIFIQFFMCLSFFRVTFHNVFLVLILILI